MNRWIACAAVAVLCTVMPAGAAGPQSVKHWHCEPCSGGCDHETYDHGGTCPHCGMKLVEARDDAPPIGERPVRKKVAILVFEGVEIVDFSGPYEIFGAAGYDVFTVGKSREPITTAMGLTLVPRSTFGDAPAADVVVVPGGSIGAAAGDAATIAWIAKASAAAKQTLTVCNGAFLLAKTGLLDGLTVTTTAHNLTRLQTQYPRLHVVDDQRFTDNGRIVTTGGLSAGIDGALHVVEKLQGTGMAEAVALSEEYDLRGRASFLPATLANMLIPDLDLDAYGSWNIEKTEGNRDAWEVVATIASPLDAAELARRLGDELSHKGGWTRADGGTFHFSGRDGRPWTGSLAVTQPNAGAPKSVRLAIARARN